MAGCLTISSRSSGGTAAHAALRVQLWGLTRLVTMLRSAGVLVAVPAAHPLTSRDLLVAGYGDFLREERGLSPLSVEAYRSDVVRFLQRSGRDGLHGLTHAEVSQAVLREVAGRSPGDEPPVAGTTR